MPGLAAIAGKAPFGLRHSHTLDDVVTDLAWSSDGKALLVGSAAGAVHRLDHGSEVTARWQAHDGGITRLRLQPGDDRVLASAGEDGKVALWNSVDGEALSTLANENDWVEHLAWTPDGKVLAAAARKTISLWQGTESLGMWYDARRHVLAMDWAPDGRRLASAANKGLYLWRLGDAVTGDAEPVQLLTFPGAPVSVAWQPQGRALAVGTQDGFLQVWRPTDTNNAARQLTMRGYPSKVNCLAWHPRRTVIATAGGPDIVLWDMPVDRTDTKNGSAKGRPLRHHQATVTAIAWSADGRLLASGDRNGRLCIWDENGDAVFSLALGSEITVVQWHPVNAVLSVADGDGRLHLVDRLQSDSGQPVRQHPARELRRAQD
ncbi:MAG: hypothetical protein H6961_01600 [Chromatiaceae bacterium]|nr:hypothetical protein [Chromatiaceae bacterium]MCP5438750.1 hypothetical protein [Chromatiaceae bacterium]